MSSLPETKKQPYEEFYIEGEFDKVLTAGETIVGSPVVTAIDKNGNDATSEMINSTSIAITADTRGVNVQIKGGSIGNSPYRIIFRVITDTPNKFELDGLIKVVES